jgi:hypothetical protein
VNPNPLTHPLAKKTAQPKLKSKTLKPKVREIIFSICYKRTNSDVRDPNPTPVELERYIAQSTQIPEHIDYMLEFNDVSPVTYIGKCRFRFTCQTDLRTGKEIAQAFFEQSMADGAWEAAPGDGSYVYPTLDGESELGVLDFEEIIVDGKKFCR